jgi:coenzyme Q-binding protein COQ10
MTIHSDSRIIFATPDRVFDMVADVESYPDFLPLWRQARVVEREKDAYWTEQTVGLGPVRERFRTKTVLRRPVRIEIVSFDELFTDFFISWDFHPMGRGCRASVALTWEMRSRGLQRAIDLLLPNTARSMVAAFEKRARELGL